MREEPFMKELPCKLTEEERLTKGDECAAKLVEVRDLELEKAAQAKEMKAKISRASLRVAELKDEIRTRTEYRDVECSESRDDHTQCIVTRRLDTGAIVDSRPMNDHERQTSLFAVVRTKKQKPSAEP